LGQAAVTVRRAGTDDVNALAPLFDAYRGFYGQPSDPELARRFLVERIGSGESVVFLAEGGGGPVGFTQLYPGFSSTRARRVFVLNDLYVAPQARRSGAAGLLLAEATAYAKAAGALELTLATARTNTAAQALYERSGWVREDGFLHYTLPLGD
jgi:ribosomal protein S18 acetylase RimI-like enzyme